MNGIVREDDTPQKKAVREAFTNMIIHADMMIGSGLLRVEKYDDRFVLTNPGLLKLPLEQIYAGVEFDPTVKTADSALEAAEEESFNLLGIGIVKNVAKEYDYKRTIGFNNFRIVL